VARVLLIEDNRAYARLVELVLGEALPGVEVVRSDSLAGAATAGAVDCVLLDLGLPDSQGVDAIGRLREAGVGAPVVVLSGHPAEQMAARARAAGAVGYVTKDADRGALAAAVAQALG
jgi:DNA-binding response OmpR family regulator